MELKGARWFVSSVAALAAVAACTSKGSGPPPGATFDGSVASDASFQEDSGADSSALRDATQEQATQEAATTDSASDSALEAGDASIPDAGADGTTVLCSAGMTDPLTSVSSMWTVGPGGSSGLPAAATCLTMSEDAGDLEAGVDGGSAGCVQVINGQAYVEDTLFWGTPLPMDAFDLSLTFTAQCNTMCGDGMAMLWLDSTTFSALGPYMAGGNLGIPDMVGGYGVALDMFQNPPPINDPTTPAWELLGLSASMSPGNYDWHLASLPAATDMTGGVTVHTVVASLRNGTLTLTLDGATLSSPVTTFHTGVFGFAGATGSSTATITISQLSASFYSTNPVCPPLSD